MTDYDKARDAATDLMVDIQRIIGADNPYLAVELCRYIEYREAQHAEKIKEIADKIDYLFRRPLPSFRVMGQDLPPSISATDFIIQGFRALQRELQEYQGKE